MPLLSIVIPTRNRHTYLIDSVQIALDNLTDAEIIICDNSDDNRLHTSLSNVIDNRRVKYLYSNESLSVVDNFEKALALTSGEYVMFIGDDDAIGPNLEEIALWAKSRQVDAVVSYRNSFLASYFWPGVKSKYYGDAYSASLFVNSFDGHHEKIQPISTLKNVAARLGGGLDSLPRIYHGLIHRTLINKILEEHGHLFGGVSPDIYSAALIASHCNNAMIVDWPFVIPGASPRSTAGQGAERSDRGDLRSTEHIHRFGEAFQWDSRIPEFYSPHTVWAFSLCKALDQVSITGVHPEFGHLYASCYLYYRSQWKQIFCAMRTMAKEYGWRKIGIYTAKGFIKEALFQIIRLSRKAAAPKAGGNAVCYCPNESIQYAYAALKLHIEKNNIALKLY